MGASLYFGAAAVGGGVAGAAVAGAAVAGAAVAGAGVAVAGVHAERIVDRTRIQASAIIRVVLVLDGFILFFSSIKSGLSSETKLPSGSVHNSIVSELDQNPLRDSSGFFGFLESIPRRENYGKFTSWYHLLLNMIFLMER